MWHCIDTCIQLKCLNKMKVIYRLPIGQWCTEGGVWGVQTPPKIPKALQNRAKLNPIVKTVKNC